MLEKIPSWLKGGIAFAIVGAFAIPYLLPRLAVSAFFLGLPGYPLFSWLISLLNMDCEDVSCSPTVTTYTLSTIISFTAGAVVVRLINKKLRRTKLG